LLQAMCSFGNERFLWMTKPIYSFVPSYRCD
jgi:hypothetical protein